MYIMLLCCYILVLVIVLVSIRSIISTRAMAPVYVEATSKGVLCYTCGSVSNTFRNCPWRQLPLDSSVM